MAGLCPFLRPLSLKYYALPLVWFKCHCINLREGDYSKLTSVIKSWLYADTLEKPEELVLYRPREEGGLGVHNIKLKSKAILICSFLETSIGSKFTRNNYHHALFRWHVLQDHGISFPGSPPYYSSDFFSSIRELMENGKCDLSRMTSSQLYKALLEKEITMQMNTEGSLELRKTKMETKFPQIQWERSWAALTTKGLTGEQTSFMMKMITNILPTRQWLLMKTTISPLCNLCKSQARKDIQQDKLERDYNSLMKYFF